MKNIENIIVILLACIVILINGQYVAEDKGGHGNHGRKLHKQSLLITGLIQKVWE